jgi:hypothetical protein
MKGVQPESVSFRGLPIAEVLISKDNFVSAITHERLKAKIPPRAGLRSSASR